MSTTIFLFFCFAGEFSLLYILYHFVFDGKQPRRYRAGLPGKPRQSRVSPFELAKNSPRAARDLGRRKIDQQTSLYESGITGLLTVVNGWSGCTSEISLDGSAKRSEASATLRLAPDDSANSNDIRHRSPLRPVAVISTSRKRTIAALRAAFLISREVRTQIRLVSVEVVPGQFPLPEPRTSGAVLEIKLRGFVHEAGLSQHEACIQVTACRHWRVGVQKALCANSVVVAGQIHWWSWRERRMMKFLSELGHEVVFANPLPSMLSS
jgi:hypothetical protein